MVDQPTTETPMAMAAKFAPELAPLARDIWEFKVHPKNVRRGNIDAIARSLQMYGQQKPIVVQESSGFIVAGNHVYQAAHRLGWQTIAASVVPMDDETAMGYLLADNRASDLATYDGEQLIQTLEGMVSSGSLQGTLWDADALDDLYAGTPKTLDPAQFLGDYGITEEQIAQRQAATGERTAATVKMKEIPVTLTADEHKEFLLMVSRLQKAYGVDGRIRAIVEAVRREWQRVMNESGESAVPQAEQVFQEDLA